MTAAVESGLSGDGGARSEGRWRLRLLPGHGCVVPSEQRLRYVEGYIEYRKVREREIWDMYCLVGRLHPPLPPSSNTPSSSSVLRPDTHPPTPFPVRRPYRANCVRERTGEPVNGGEKRVWLCLKWRNL